MFCVLGLCPFYLLCAIFSVKLHCNGAHSYIQPEETRWILVWLSGGGEVGILVQHPVKGKSAISASGNMCCFLHSFLALITSPQF